VLLCCLQNARNVLVASCSEAACGVQGKLADFGLSRSIKQHHTHRTTNTIGTISHMPPEMLRSGKMSVVRADMEWVFAVQA
jgi:serine/threonine protein kinase